MTSHFVIKMKDPIVNNDYSTRKNINIHVLHINYGCDLFSSLFYIDYHLTSKLKKIRWTIDSILIRKWLNRKYLNYRETLSSDFSIEFSNNEMIY